MNPNTSLTRREFLKVSGAGLIGAALSGWNLFTNTEDIQYKSLSKEQSPNVLLIVLDTVRTKSLGLYGHHRNTSPHLERLAKTGVFFKNSYSSSPWTLPSHAGMFTGRYPDEISADWRQPLDSTFPTISEEFRAHGYQTAGFVANHAYCISEYGLNRGFNHYEDFRKSPGQIIQGSSLVRTLSEVLDLRGYFSTNDNFGRKSAEQINRDFLSWLSEQNQSQPFFVFLNYYDAHDPYLPSKEYALKIAQREVRGYYNEKKPRKLTTQDLLNFKDAYESSIAYLDDQIGNLFENLSERGILNNSIVIIVSDHGEQFGEHDLIYHGNSLYHLLIHVPLIIIHPGKIPQGLIVDQRVSLTDLPNTILELSGIYPKFNFPGKSLTRYLKGENQDELIQSKNFISWDINRVPMTKGWNYSKIYQNWHYILNADKTEELYLLTDDPEENRNLIENSIHRDLLESFRSSSF